jgi:hypothetical protein
LLYNAGTLKSVQVTQKVNEILLKLMNDIYVPLTKEDQDLISNTNNKVIFPLLDKTNQTQEKFELNNTERLNSEYLNELGLCSSAKLRDKMFEFFGDDLIIDDSNSSINVLKNTAINQMAMMRMSCFK